MCKYFQAVRFSTLTSVSKELETSSIIAQQIMKSPSSSLLKVNIHNIRNILTE